MGDLQICLEGWREDFETWENRSIIYEEVSIYLDRCLDQSWPHSSATEAYSLCVRSPTLHSYDMKDWNVHGMGIYCMNDLAAFNPFFVFLKHIWIHASVLEWQCNWEPCFYRTVIIIVNQIHLMDFEHSMNAYHHLLSFKIDTNCCGRWVVSSN